MTKKKYSEIYKHYEDTLQKHGSNFQGMDWPDEADLHARFEVMLGLLKYGQKPDKTASVLDLGCGIGLLLAYCKKFHPALDLDYYGIDISEKMIDGAKSIHKDESFEARDILENPLPDDSYDYIVMNGLLTEKLTLPQDAMVEFAQQIIHAAYKSSKTGIAFNVMSSHVDWKRDDLFHWPLDELMSFLTKEISRNVIFRMDYGLYEFTTYVFKNKNT
ncbi:MAG: class I SAM-dependent methyltransferase [Reichenbachiella sp.]|uniref:class I SAM-dependent methyltransferase n=1 Tax=Reichenbachiella sp. TaxID=2184521 RepID=UPI003267565F